MSGAGGGNSETPPKHGGPVEKRVPILKRLTRKRILVVIGVVLLWAYNVEAIQEALPFLLAAQLRFHQLLSKLEPWNSRVKWVTPVEIDDATFWRPPLSGVQPTKRKYLAKLALAAANAGAAVIALDFQLKSPTPAPGDDETRKEDNDYLLEVLYQITQKGTRVVLSAGLVANEKGQWKEEPNIFPDEAWPAGTALGYINVPLDPRQIPLQVGAVGWDEKTEKQFSSLAFETASAYQAYANLSARLGDDSKIQKAIQKGEFVYGRFLKVSDFSAVRISGRELASGKAGPTRCCRGRIVLIGGTWHSFGENRGPLVDSHLTPAGEIPGLYLHANYVEALLDQKYKQAVSHRSAVLLDLLLAVLLYIGFDLLAARGWRAALVMAILVAPLLLAYLLFASTGLYLDCIMPLGACLVDLGLEHYMELRGLAKQR